MFGALLVTVLIATSSATHSTNVSASASGGSSAEASSVVHMNAGTSTVEVWTVVDGKEEYERRESRGGTTSVEVHATSSEGSSSATSSTSTVAAREAAVERVLSLVRRILSFFGLSLKDL